MRSLAFGLSVRSRRLNVEITHQSARYLLTAGEPLQIVHHGTPQTLAAGEPQSLAIPPLVHGRPRPSQPPGRSPAARLTTRKSERRAGMIRYFWPVACRE